MLKMSSGPLASQPLDRHVSDSGPLLDRSRLIAWSSWSLALMSRAVSTLGFVTSSPVKTLKTDFLKVTRVRLRLRDLDC